MDRWGVEKPTEVVYITGTQSTFFTFFAESTVFSLISESLR